MKRNTFHITLIVCLAGILAFLTSCTAFPLATVQKESKVPMQNQAVTTQAGSLSINTLTAQVLDNMHLHSWNPNARTHNKVTGGLFINWQMDEPQITNAVTPNADGNAQHNHDPQVDLLYLVSLAEYQQLHPNDHRYDSDIVHTTTLVITDFKNYSLPKGWLYFYLFKAGTMLQSDALVHEAELAASNFYQHWYDPQLGYVYERVHTPGDYSVDHDFQCGAALIDAGLRWQVPAWVQAGENTLNHLLKGTLDPTYHQLYNSMIVGLNGADHVQNYQAKPSTQGEAVQALLIAYELTHNQQYLNVAGQILQALFGPLGLWDSGRGGLYFAYDMKKGSLLTDYKETRSQTLVLIALHHYNKLTGQRMKVQEQELTASITDKFYQHTYKGFFYRVASNFQVYVSRPGAGIGVEDFFTTEAMGSAMDALQQTELS